MTTTMDDPMCEPMRMVAERRETARRDIYALLEEVYAKLDERRRAEEEAAWTQWEQERGGNHG